jgi:hypothetical protein
MKYLFSAMLMSIVLTFCNNQKLPAKIPYDSPLARSIVKDTALTLDFNAEKQMMIFADSLNNLARGNSFPSFLYNECFDWNTAYWPDMHHPVSLRQIIVSKVINKSVIEKILKVDDPLLRKVCDLKSSLSIPKYQKSFYELFKLRYAELK